MSEAGRVFDCYNDTGEEFLTGINDAYEASGYVIDSDYVVRTTFQEKPVKSRLWVNITASTSSIVETGKASTSVSGTGPSISGLFEQTGNDYNAILRHEAGAK